MSAGKRYDGGDVPILHGSLSLCLFITRCKRGGGGQGPGFKFQRMQSRVSRAVARSLPKCPDNRRSSTPRCRPQSHASKSSARQGIRLIVAKDAMDAHAVAHAEEARDGGQCASRSRDKGNCRTGAAARRGLDVARDAPNCAVATHRAVRRELESHAPSDGDERARCVREV